MTSGDSHSKDEAKVLIVDDDATIRAVVSKFLTKEGFTVETATSGQEALEKSRDSVDVTVLDITMPDIDGFEVCRRIRADGNNVYILMLTNKKEEVDKLVGLSLGADDYMIKPFSPRELVARIRALMRRPRSGAGNGTGSSEPAAPVKIGDLEIDFEAREVKLNDKPVKLTKIEFDLLSVLSSRPRMAFSRTQLLESVWGSDWFGDDHVVDVHISNLRRKLESPNKNEARYVETVRGIGYRMGVGNAS